MMQLTATAEDYLERLYMRDVEGDTTDIPAPDDRVLGELLRRNLLRHEQTSTTLTKEGSRIAEGVVRRHRLAERLIHDVLDVHGKQVDSAACEFEHSLHHGVDDRICTLLGHPKTCPHGHPIPPGKCCKEHKGATTPAVSALVDLKGGERGTIAYLSSRQTDTVQKLMALGVLPGSPVAVIQTYPSVVFQVGQTQVAVDQTLAEDIYIRRTE
ncbi:MAG TPA: metal-dependent transcriptional regulator [Armatimonadota bacterium]|nr:metal-dependent transcriptional regulator [Armatimonadota bacterium]